MLDVLVQHDHQDLSFLTVLALAPGLAMYSVWEGGRATLHWPIYTGLQRVGLIYSFPFYNTEGRC